MFKQFKTGGERNSISPSQSTSSSSSISTLSNSHSSNSDLTNATNVSRPSSPIRTQQSALHLLQQQRRQNQAATNGNLIQKWNQTNNNNKSTPINTPKKGVRSSTNNTVSTSTTKLPNTARKKVKSVKAVGGGGEDGKKEAEKVVKEDDSTENTKDEEQLVAAADETSVMEDKQEEPAEDDEMDAEGEVDENITPVQIKKSQSIELPIEKVSDEDEAETSSISTQNVVVCVRVRSTKSKKGEEEAPMWTLDGDLNRILPTEQHPTLAKRSTAAATTGDAAIAEDGSYDFRFDSLVLPSQSADQMYSERIAPVVDAVVKGYNGTVFAYGQTGSGKTYTMSGSESEKGVIPKAVGHIFDRVAKITSREFLLRVSYLEIYNESLNDLLAALPSTSASASMQNANSSPDDDNGRPSSPIKGGSSHMVTNGSNNSGNGLRMFESAGRVQIQGLREEIVTDATQVLDLLEKGQNARHQAATDWNERSSRSHCVFMLTVESRAKENKSSNVRLSQLNLIDLAGSERAASEKERRKEGAFINKSLLTLGTVIAKLSEQCASGKQEQHIPYRDSKLTRLLQSSLGGNARVAVVCTLSPKKEHAIESLSTLRFGSRCKMVTTRAKQGSVVDDKALIARYRRELEKLRAQLELGNTTTSNDQVAAAPTVRVEDDESIKALHQEREKAERDVKAMNDQRSELKKQIEHLTRLILTGKDVEQGQQQAAVPEEEDEGDRSKRIRAARKSDLGTSSPSKRNVARFPNGISSPLTPLPSSKMNSKENGMDTPLASKPFAMESELAQMRKSLSKALAAKQASEEARRKEVQLWQAKVSELEEANKEQEDELDEAEEAFKRLQSERDEAFKRIQTERESMRAQVHEEREANRLLKLVAQSRTSDLTEEQKRSILERETEIKKLRQQLEKAEKEQESLQSSKADHEKQVQDLQEQLEKAKGSAGERVTELEAELEVLRASSTNTSDDEKNDTSAEFKDASQGEVELLKEKLRITEEEKQKLEKELQQNALDRGQEDAERDFADLVKGGDNATTALQKELQELKDQLKKQSQENQEQKTTIEELKANNGSKPLPVPSLSPSSSASPSMNDDLRTSMERQLKMSEERCKALEKQMEMMSRNQSIPSPPNSVSSVSSSSSRSPAVVELQIESDIQKSRIASLERQLSEAKARVQDTSLGSISLPGSPLKWSSSSQLASTRSNPATPNKRGLDNVREEDDNDDGDETMMLHAGPYSSASLNGRRGRGGSMRDYKRYSTSRTSFGGGDLAIPSRSTEELERQLKEEREEIERLNGVIATQRTIMAELEASVVTWKKRLRTQQEIITKLVEAAGVKASPSLIAQSQSLAVGESTSMIHNNGGRSSGVDLKRTSSNASTSSASSAPYYGAHLYNRPPAGLSGAAQGLGLGSSSPTKGTAWLSSMPGIRPDPLPLPDYAISAGLSSPNGKAARRRKTIENEIESLKESPRVEHTKSRLLEPQQSTNHYPTPPQSSHHHFPSPQRLSRPLPVLGSPPKQRPSKDWYI
ncbi:hypothetical protein L7F22_019846 [Adiantum nelumboides]|nr:hypothetical protein [Adiantum nelumboides]